VTRYLGNYHLVAGQTPSQTVGPFFHQGLLRTRAGYHLPSAPAPADLGSDAKVSTDQHGGTAWHGDTAWHGEMAGPNTVGIPLSLTGAVYDGWGQPVTDALVELWQADANGHYHHPLDPRSVSDPHFRGFARVATGKQGEFRFDTIRPGSVPGPNGTTQAPHLNLTIFARGMLKHLHTRAYFEGDPLLASDPILSLVSPEHRPTLIARRLAPPTAPNDAPATERYRFDIHLQGAAETTFFEI
jgi:protocatechuate 3,4-dioxygenase, alpha subunit